MASRTSILETIPKVVCSPPKIKPKSTTGRLEKIIFDIRRAIGGHKLLSIAIITVSAFSVFIVLRRRMRKSRGGFLRLDEKDGLLGGTGNGKVD
jgi:protein disulfide-isomerase